MNTHIALFKMKIEEKNIINIIKYNIIKFYALIIFLSFYHMIFYTNASHLQNGRKIMHEDYIRYKQIYNIYNFN